jgi:hypothetical protein
MASVVEYLEGEGYAWVMENPSNEDPIIVVVDENAENKPGDSSS